MCIFCVNFKYFLKRSCDLIVLVSQALTLIVSHLFFSRVLVAMVLWVRDATGSQKLVTMVKCVVHISLN